jgi:hypothetical protein
VTIKNIEGDKITATTWIVGPSSYHNQDLKTMGTLTVDNEGVPVFAMDASGYASYTVRLVAPDKLEGELRGSSGTARLELKAKKK